MNTPLTIGAIILIGAGTFLGYHLMRDTTSKVDLNSAEVRAQAAETIRDVDALIHQGKASEEKEKRAQDTRREADRVATQVAVEKAEREKSISAFGDAVKDLYGLAEGK